MRYVHTPKAESLEYETFHFVFYNSSGVEEHQDNGRLQTEVEIEWKQGGLLGWASSRELVSNTVSRTLEFNENATKDNY